MIAKDLISQLLELPPDLEVKIALPDGRTAALEPADVDAAGGEAIVLRAHPAGNGAAWSEDFKHAGDDASSTEDGDSGSGALQERTPLDSDGSPAWSEAGVENAASSEGAWSGEPGEFKLDQEQPSGLEDEDTEPNLGEQAAAGGMFAGSGDSVESGEADREEKLTEDGPFFRDSSAFASDDTYAIASEEGTAAGLHDAPAASTAAPALATSPRKPKPTKNPLVEGVKIVVGGLAGLAIGYLILIWVLRKDPIPPLASKLPAFLLPAELKSPTSASEAGSQVATPSDKAKSKSAEGDFTDDELGGAASATQDVPGKKNKKTAKADAVAAKTPAADEGLDMTPLDAGGDLEADSGFGELDAGLGEDDLDISAPELTAPTLVPPGGLETEPVEEDPADEEPLESAPEMEIPADTDAAEETPRIDIAATELPALEDIVIPADMPPAEPAEEAPAVTLKGAPSFTVEDLQARQQAAEQAYAAYTGAGQATEKERTRLKGGFYKSLCDLAETVTFASHESADLDTRLQRIEGLLSNATKDPGGDELGRIAGLWLKREKRGGSGLLAAGVVKHVSQHGSVTKLHVELPGDGVKSVTVLSDDKPTIKAGDKVTVLGSIVSDPQQAIAGLPEGALQGETGFVVWAGHIVTGEGR